MAAAMSDTNRRAIVLLPYEAVATMLELPPGLTVHAIYPDPLRDAFAVKVTGDSLADVPAGDQAPLLAQVHLVVDTQPILDALRKMHTVSADSKTCHHCEYIWPCPTIRLAEDEALTHPLQMRRFKVEWPI